jgi:hypothetical protein
LSRPRHNAPAGQGVAARPLAEEISGSPVQVVLVLEAVVRLVRAPGPDMTVAPAARAARAARDPAAPAPGPGPAVRMAGPARGDRITTPARDRARVPAAAPAPAPVPVVRMAGPGQGPVPDLAPGRVRRTGPEPAARPRRQPRPPTPATAGRPARRAGQGRAQAPVTAAAGPTVARRRRTISPGAAARW